MAREKALAFASKNPMVEAFGLHASPGLLSEACKCFGRAAIRHGRRTGPHVPVCELRGQKPHNEQWPACSKFITWDQWRDRHDSEWRRKIEARTKELLGI